MNVQRLGIAMAVATAVACRTAAPQSNNVASLSAALQTAFHVQAAASLGDSGRTLSITIDMTPGHEIALRVAQFARTHYDSVASLDAIELTFMHVEQMGALRKTTRVRAGAFLPALLPVDTTPGWTQAMLAPTPTPPLAVSLLDKPSADTLVDTAVSGRPAWRMAIASRGASDIITFDRATLRPIEERRTDAAGTITARFDGPHLHVTLESNGRPAVVHDTTFEIAPFSSTELDILIRTLPLAKGYTTRLPVWRPNSISNGLDWVTILVSGIDTARNAWVVDAAGTGINFRRRWVSLASSATSALPAAWTTPVKPFQIVGDVYYVGTEGLAAYLIKSPDGAVLLDGTLAENAPLIERSIEALGVPLTAVKLLISDHAHNDHVGALAQLKKDTGAPFAASAGDQWALEHGQTRGQMTYVPTPFPPIKVDRLVRDGDTIRVGSISVTAHLTPGHTPGCTSWSTTVRADNRPVDVLFLCSITVAGNVLVGNKVYPEIATDFAATFRKLAAMKADVVLTSHPEMADVLGREARRETGKPNPFIDPAALPAIVADARAAFDTALDGAKAAAAKSP